MLFRSLIQLEHAGAVRLMKAPGGVLATVDLVINELGPKLGDEVVAEGVLVRTSMEAETVRFYELQVCYPAIGIVDLHVLAHALCLDAVLLTGDRLLRQAAENEGLVAHGLLWLLDSAITDKVIERQEASHILRTIQRAGARLPDAECNARFAKWL